LNESTFFFATEKSFEQTKSLYLITTVGRPSSPSQTGVDDLYEQQPDEFPDSPYLSPIFGAPGSSQSDRKGRRTDEVLDIRLINFHHVVHQFSQSEMVCFAYFRTRFCSALHMFSLEPLNYNGNVATAATISDDCSANRFRDLVESQLEFLFPTSHNQRHETQCS
jgi:hypothetical protein